MNNTLDIRDLTETGLELKTAIANAVADTQRYIIRTLPDKLIMTQVQYDILEDDPDLVGTIPNERIYITPHNAMDCIIREKHEEI